MKNRSLYVLFAATIISGIISLTTPHRAAADTQVTAFIPQSVLDGQLKAALNLTLNGCYENASNGWSTTGAFHESGNPTALQISSGDWFDTGFTAATPTTEGGIANSIVKKYILKWTPSTSFYCDNFNKAKTTGTGVDILGNQAKNLFGWSGMIDGACKIGLVRAGGGDCMNDSQSSAFKRAGYVSQAKDVKPSSDTAAGKYIQGSLLCADASFIEVATIGADSKAKYTNSTIYNIVVRNKLPDGTYELKSVPSYEASDAGGTCFSAYAGTDYAKAYIDYLRLPENTSLVQEKTATIETPATEGGSSTDGAPTCTVDGIGWIVCPVMNFMAGVNDTLFGALSSMLNVPPTIFTANSGTDKYADLYAAWNAFRGYANILFIVAFLIIIYSQITSAGITNYGIKKLLPKLIIAAILVNASYYLCQIAVDLSNILGYGLKSLFVAIGGGIDTSNSATGNWASNIGGALAVVGAAAGVIALVLAISVPVVLSGLLALLMVVIILIVRRAAIILLIVISPLAFVAWLLPNTQKWFKKWWDLFLSMLVLFPVISALFGAGALAGKILGSADFGDDAGVAKLAALGASVLPLFATIPLLQGALKATGAVGAKLSGMSSAANKRMTSGAQKTGKERYDNSSFAKGRALRKQGKEEWRNRRFAQAISGDDTSLLSRARRKAALGVTNGKIPNLTKRGGFAQDRVQSAAQAKLSAMEAEKHKEEQTEIANIAQTFRTMPSAKILDKATSADSSDIERAAAIQHIMKSGSHDEKRAVLAASHTTAAGGHAKSAVAEGYFSSGANEVWGNGLGDKIKAGEELDLDAEMKANFGNMTGGTLLKGAKVTADIKRVAATATDTELSSLATAVHQVETNAQLQTALTGNVATDFGVVKGAVDAAVTRSGGGTP